MRSDTVTLILSGEVPLETFANAIHRFSDLVTGLSIEKNAGDLDWILNDLQISSAVATALGRGEEEKVIRVVRAYEEVGTALERAEPIPYSKRVQIPARALRAIVGGRIESVILETAQREAIIRPTVSDRIAVTEHVTARLSSPSPSPLRPLPAAYGAVEGRVQTLSSRGGLR